MPVVMENNGDGASGNNEVAMVMTLVLSVGRGSSSAAGDCRRWRHPVPQRLRCQ